MSHTRKSQISTKKSAKLRGRPEKGIAHIQQSIPHSAEQIAKAILKAPPGANKSR